MKRAFLRSLVAVALVGSGLGITSAAAPIASVGMAEKAKCKPGAQGSTNARLGIATPNLRKDPNTLTQAEANAMEARITGILERNNVTPSARANGAVKVPVHVHVLMSKKGEGNVANHRIHRQMKVINRGFSGSSSTEAANTPFRFRLKSIDRVKNGDWAEMDRQDSIQARQALRIGDSRHLNMYTADSLLGGLLGFATFPEYYKKHPKLDGLVVWDETLPGGDAVFTDDEGTTFNYAKGDTATHEIGHWMNLYHTFQGSCTANNDFVVDTARQRAADNVFYCKRHQNTCASPTSSPDPVENFMSYGDDVCLDTFTLGQRDRMNLSWYVRQVLSH